MASFHTYDPRFRAPANMQIVGPSMCGKTTWLYRLVRDAPTYLAREDGSPCLFQKMVYCYGSNWQPIFEDFRDLGVVFYKGLPEGEMTELFPVSQRPGLLMLDDLMVEASKSRDMTQLLTRDTHHSDLFTITLCQNLYPGGREQVSQNRNYHYAVLFKNPADTRYVKALGNRWLGDSQAFWEIYKRATDNPYGYLVVDNHPRTPEALRFRTHLLLDEPQPVTVLHTAHKRAAR